MDFSQSQCIRDGTNAGLPRPLNDVVMDQMKAVWKLTQSLKRNGFNVLASDTNACTGPTIQVLPNVKTEEMIATGQAEFDRCWTTADGVEMRHGKFKVDGVRVIWIEMATPDKETDHAPA